MRNFAIIAGRSAAPVHHVYNRIGLIHGLASLCRHEGGDALRLSCQAAGIDYQIRPVADSTFTILTIARDARLIRDNGIASTRERIEQRGFADIRAADQDNDGFHERFGMREASGVPANLKARARRGAARSGIRSGY